MGRARQQQAIDFVVRSLVSSAGDWVAVREEIRRLTASTEDIWRLLLEVTSAVRRGEPPPHEELDRIIALAEARVKGLEQVREDAERAAAGAME